MIDYPKYILAILPEKRGDELRQTLPAEYNLLGLIAIFLVGLNYWVIE